MSGMCILCVKSIAVILTVQGETKCYKNKRGRARERKRERLKLLVEGAGKPAKRGHLKWEALTAFKAAGMVAKEPSSGLQLCL